jgi:hypothetical protein
MQRNAINLQAKGADLMLCRRRENGRFGITEK